MMKSFFKKLAFVMAFAMVVAAVAPAGAVFAADAAGIALQTAKSDAEILKADTLAVDETVDYKFYGCANWRTAGLKWTSSDEKVATVAQDGKVTGVAEGTATVTLKSADGSYEASIKITVEKPVDVNAFEAKQKSHITFDVNFNKEVSYGRDDVHLYRVFETDKGDVYVVWAVRDAKLSDDKKTLTVEPYVQFGDGDRYLVAFQDLEKKLNSDNKDAELKNVPYDEFITYIGDVDKVIIDWYSLVNDQKIWANSDELQNIFAYTNGEDAEEDIENYLTYKLMSGEVDLTEIYKNDGYLEFKMMNEEEVGEYAVLSEDCLVFTKANEAVTLEAVYTFEDKEGEEKTAKSDVTTIISKQLEPFAIQYVKEWSFTNQGDWSWTKPVQTIRAGKIGDIALLVVDNRGGQWETVAKDSKIPEFGADDTDTEEMYLKFYSTHTDYFLVDTYPDSNVGRIETYTAMKKAVVYVALHDEALLADADDDFVRNIGACVMEIKEPVKFSGLAVYGDGDGDGTWYEDADKISSTTIITDAVEDPAYPDRFVDEITKRAYIIKAVDQDGNVYNPGADKVLTDTTIEYTISTTNKDLRELFGDSTTGYDTVIWTEADSADEENGVADFEIDAWEVRAADIKSSTISIKITATQYDEAGKKIKDESETFKISLRDPEFYDEDDAEKAAIPGLWEIYDVKPTSWKVDAGDSKLFTLSGEKSASVVIPLLSKSYTVGYYNRYNMSEIGDAGQDITIIEDSAKYLFGKDGEKNGEPIEKIHAEGIYVLVVGPDGKAVKAATDNGLGDDGLGVYLVEDYTKNAAVAVRVTGDDDGNGDLDYMPVGKYTVKVTFVTDVDTDALGNITDVEYKTRTDYFEVKDDLVPVKYLDMYEVTTALEIDDMTDDFATNADKDTIVEIIQENMKLDFRGKDHYNFDQNEDGTKDSWQPTAAQIRDVSFFVRGGYITFKSITFQIESGDSYYVYTLRDINKSVKLGVEEE